MSETLTAATREAIGAVLITSADAPSRIDGALLRGLTNHGLLQGPLLWIIIGAVVAALIAVLFLGGGEKEPDPELPEGPFDAFAGGFPVPPLPGQTLPEMAGVVAGQTDQAAPAASDDRKDEE